MGDYIDIGGHATWVEQEGDSTASETVLLLHGGFGNSDMLLGGLGGALGDRYRLVAFDRRGHGRTADTDQPFHYDDMAEEVVAVLEQVVGGPAHLVGYSDGGIISLRVVLSRPELVRSMVLIGTNFHHEGVLPVEMGDAGDNPVFAMIEADYSERSPDGAEHFGAIAAKTFALFTTEPTMAASDLTAIECPALVVAGDDDMVALAHTCALYESLPAGQLAIVPGTSHVLPMEKPDLLARLVADFLASEEPPMTFMPVRRRA